MWISLKSFNLSMDFLAQRYVIYSLRECHYLKRTQIDVKLKFALFSGFSPANHDDDKASHHDVLVVCQAQAY